MKKLLSFLLVFMLIISVVPLGAFTLTASADTSGYYTYTVSNREATITDVDTSISGDITIPDTLGGYPVTSIRRNSFYNCTNLTNVTIPDSVTSIGSSAFNGCTSLTTVKLGYGVTSTYVDSFVYCPNLIHIEVSNANQVFFSIDGVLFRKYKTALIVDLYPNGRTAASYTIPDGITRISSSAFSNCTNLTNVTIPDSITSISESAFECCTNLTTVKLGTGVTSIGKSAFKGCTNLPSITIPDSVTSIGYNAFYNTGLYNNNSNWENNVLYIGKHLIIARNNIRGSYTIKSGTLTVADNAFYNCTNLTNVTIPDSVTSIGDYAFDGCTGFRSITIPDSITSIGDYAFRGCTGLTIVSMPANFTSMDTTIGDRAFYDCQSLASITIPNGVTSIGASAFYNCTNLPSITIPDSVTSIGASAFYNTGLYNNNSNWENNVLYIGKHLIKARNISGTYEIKPGTITIAERAFYELDGLKNITIPNSIKNIGAGAFYGCGYLTSITIPNGVTNIGGSAFYNCTNLTSITIPDSVTSIGDSAFYNCTDLTTVYYMGSVENRNEITLSVDDALINATWYYNSCIDAPNHTYNHSCDTTCNVCGTTRTISHIYDDNCDSYCNVCWEYRAEPPHTYSGACDSDCNYCGNTRKAPHNYKKIVTKPTCIDKGYTTHTCSGCGDSYVDNYVNATGHSYNNTCDTTCNICGAIRTITHSYNSVIIKPTCTNQGYTTHTCSVCGNTYNDNYKNATGHVYDNTCDTNCNICGTLRTVNHSYSSVCDRDCNICGAYRKAPHDYDNACDDECGLCGTQREVPDHTYDNACDTDCNECGVVRTVPDHVYDNACDTTCNECGAVRSVSPHVYDNACDTTCNICNAVRNTTHSYDNNCDTSCNVCGYVRTVTHIYTNICDTTCNICNQIRTVEHNYSNTCDIDCNICGFTREALHTFTNECDGECNICFDTRKPPHKYAADCDTICDYCCKERVVTSDHIYEWIIDTESTCNTKGTKHEECTGCHAIRNENTLIDVTNKHIYDNTCDTDCNICGTTRSTSHDYNSVVTNPTCTEHGFTIHTCNICGDTYIDNYTDATGHIENDWIIDKKPTCTMVGSKHKVCTVCNNTVTESIDALGHDEITHKAQNVTCTEIGWNEYVTCSRCDYTTYEEIAALGHDEIIHEAKAPTCTEIGWDAYVTCSRCDYTTYNEIVSLGHRIKAPDKVWVDSMEMIQDPSLNTDTFVLIDGVYQAVNSVEDEESFLAFKALYDCMLNLEYSVSAGGVILILHTRPNEDAEEIDYVFGESDWKNLTLNLSEGDIFAVYHALYDSTLGDGIAYIKLTCTQTQVDAIIDAPAENFEPDCTSGVVCDYCGTIVKEALGHNEITHEAHSPTCTEIGWDEYATCSRCDYTTYEEISALGHDEITHEAHSPTCTEIGWDEYVTCSRCNYTTYSEILATGVHNYVGVVTDPTCTEQGFTTHTCDMCGDNYVDDYVDTIGHTYDDDFDAFCNECNAKRDAKKHGDSSGDGVINNKDCALLMQYINGWDVEIDDDPSDVNSDGKINNKDYVLIMRYINGWNVVLK